MTDLTREEIRRACEAVGWKWDEDSDFAFDPEWSYPWRFHPAATNDGNRRAGDALALLEATGEPLYIERCDGMWDVGIHSGCGECLRGHVSAHGPTLPTAAVRAVNAWAESRKENDHGRA